MRLIGAWVAVTLLLIGASCRSKSTALVKKETATYQQQTSESSTRERASSTEHFGDKLSGRVPLPLSRPNVPGVTTVIPVSSAGIDLTLTIDSTGINYEVVAKPVSKTSVAETETQSKSSLQASAITQEEEKSKETKPGIPWWIILIGIVLVVIAIGVRGLKSKFKLF